MKRRQWCLALILGLALTSGQQLLAADKELESMLRVAEFGTSVGKPINTGFVFIRGRYIRAPYIVSRKGLGLFINDVFMWHPKRWERLAQKLGDASVAKRIELDRIGIEQQLRLNYCYFFKNENRLWKITPTVILRDLPQLVHVLNSNEPREVKIQALKRTGYHLSYTQDEFAAFVGNCWIPEKEILGRLREQEASILRLKECRETVGEPLESGFLFYDGRYIDTPYRVTRRGVAVFINDVMVELPDIWATKTQLASGEVNPKIPAGITREHNMDDKLVFDFIGEKIAYISVHFSGEKAIEMLADTYRKLPCVISVKANPGMDEITVTTYCRVYPPTMYIFYGEKHSVPTMESWVQRQETYRKRYEEHLQRNGGYFFFDGGGMITFSPDDVLALSEIVGILRSDASVEEKFAAIQKAGMSYVKPNHAFSKLVTEFSASKQLAERLEKLRIASASQRHAALVVRDDYGKQQFVDSLFKLPADEHAPLLGKLATSKSLRLREKQDAVHAVLKQVNLCFRGAKTRIPDDRSPEGPTPAYEKVLAAVLDVLATHQFLVSKQVISDLMETLNSACPLALNQKALQLVRQNASIYSVYPAKFSSGPNTVALRVFVRVIPSRESLPVRLRDGDAEEFELAIKRVRSILEQEKKLDKAIIEALVELGKRQGVAWKTRRRCIELVFDAGELIQAEELLDAFEASLGTSRARTYRKWLKAKREKLEQLRQPKPETTASKKTPE